MKKILSIMLVFLMVIAFPVSTSAKEKNIVSKAKSVVLMSMNDCSVLYEKNSREHLSPASVTKIMSILLIVEAIDNGKINLKDKVTVSSNAHSMGGSQIWLEVGEKMTVDELLKAVIVSSANDACTALGEYVSGSSLSFVKAMNNRAKELGLKDTNFENCTGLDDDTENHYSCAYDLAVISAEVMKHKIVQNYTTIWLDSLRNGKTELNNTNKLVKTYNGITGLKTGTTSKAGFCVSATATRDGLDLVAVVLGADTSEDRFKIASSLLDEGFSEYCVVKPVFDKTKIGEVSVKYGEIKKVAPAISSANPIVLKKSHEDLSYDYDIIEEVEAPIKKGDVLGKINIKSSGKRIMSVNLVSDKTINKMSFISIFKQLLINI